MRGLRWIAAPFSAPHRRGRALARSKARKSARTPAGDDRATARFRVSSFECLETRAVLTPAVVQLDVNLGVTLPLTVDTLTKDCLPCVNGAPIPGALPIAFTDGDILQLPATGTASRETVNVSGTGAGRLGKRDHRPGRRRRRRLFNLRRPPRSSHLRNAFRGAGPGIADDDPAQPGRKGLPQSPRSRRGWSGRHPPRR